MLRFASILTTLWAGSLWTVCGIVAPTLFATLDDRRLAGQIAARFFHIEAWLGLVIGAFLIGIVIARKTLAARTATLCWIGLTAGAPVLSELALGPMMDSARAANNMTRFGALHGVASGLFFAACFGALVLVWRFNRPAE